MKRRLATVAAATLAVGAAVCVSGCCQVPTAAQSASFAALGQAWQDEARMSELGADAMLESGEVNEAGKAVLDARREAFGRLIDELQSGGQ
jgi:hypothetical protein